MQKRIGDAITAERGKGIAAARQELQACRERLQRARSAYLACRPRTLAGARAQLHYIAAGDVVRAGEVGQVERGALFGILAALKAAGGADA